MREKDIYEITQLIERIRNLKKQSPNAHKSIAWFAKNIKKVDIILSQKYIPPEILSAIIEDFYASGSYEAAVFACYKLIIQETNKTDKSKMN